MATESAENSLASGYEKLKKAGKAALVYMHIVPKYSSNDQHDPESYRPTSVSAEG